MSYTLGKIKRTNGVAGQVAYSTVVAYDDEPACLVTFVGSVYGGPVVIVTETFGQMFVTNPNRFGQFGPEWVRRFYAD